jgi:23S rRNA pseudouridine955/2504/2580 synthase
MKDPVKEPAAKYPVSPNEEGQRLDNYLLRRIKGVPKSYIYKIIRDGQVRLNSGRAKPTTRLSSGDIVRIPPLRRATAHELPADLADKLVHPKILFEDDDLLVVTKPPGLAAHSGSGQRVGLIELLRMKREGYLELAHRLDKDTSGVIALALNVKALRSLHAQFQDSRGSNYLSKKYLALVNGQWRGGHREINQPLLTIQTSSATKQSVASPDGRSAVSIFTPLEKYKHFTLMEIELKTGRLHQVRAHARVAGFPVSGDSLYGSKAVNRRLRSIGLRRQFLHASSLGFAHPRSGKAIQVNAPLPEDLGAVIARLPELDGVD